MNRVFANAHWIRSARWIRPLLTAAALALVGFTTGACKAKPSKKACQEAVDNILRITGQSTNHVGSDPTTSVMSCRGSSTKDAVNCMRLAKDLKDLEACEVAAKRDNDPTPNLAPEAKAKAEPVPAKDRK